MTKTAAPLLAVTLAAACTVQVEDQTEAPLPFNAENSTQAFRAQVTSNVSVSSVAVSVNGAPPQALAEVSDGEYAGSVAVPSCQDEVEYLIIVDSPLFIARNFPKLGTFNREVTGC